MQGLPQPSLVFGTTYSCFRQIMLKKGFAGRPWGRRRLGLSERELGCTDPAASAGGCRRVHRDQLRELAEVLGGGGEVELVEGTVRAS